MKPTQAITAVTAAMLKDTVPDFGVGDTVRISVRVVEGSRERIQVFEGVVMRKRGGGINANFTVRRIAAHGIGVERTFLLNSPRVDKIEVTRRGVVRRAQLYYLRGLTGKAARIKERRYRPADRAIAAEQAAASRLAAEQAAADEAAAMAAADELDTDVADEADLETADVEATDVDAAEDEVEPTADADTDTDTDEDTEKA